MKTTTLFIVALITIWLLASCITDKRTVSETPISPLSRGAVVISPLPEPTPAARSIFLPTIIR
jgi:hypothetical protein